MTYSRTVLTACALAAFYGVEVQAAPTEKVLHNFGTHSPGSTPEGGVIRDAGNFYGTTAYGGKFNQGVAYKVDSSGRQTVLYTFTGGADGANPTAALTRDAVGNFYGTTSFGGKSGAGVVFKLDTAGHETVLYGFTGGSDGGGPQGVVRESAGNLYGTTLYGGTFDLGAVYKLDTVGNETALYSFTGGNDGESPAAGVVRDSAGNLYGATIKGSPDKAGVIFKIDTTGAETTLYTFTGGKDGRNPSSPLILDSAGNLYGTTSRGGGKADAGVVFKLSPTGHLTTLYTFPSAAQGGPSGSLAMDSQGNFYGATAGAYPIFAGIVYRLSPAGQQTTLYAFSGGADGANAASGVILDSAGNVYGTATAGGPGNVGALYEVASAGQQTVLYGFHAALDGTLPATGLIADSAGNLYGTTENGGAYNAGTVFKVDPSGRQTVLYNFKGGTDAVSPVAPLALDSAGNLYGTTNRGGASNNGAVYKVDTSGNETVLYSFTGLTDGGAPYAGVVLDPAGNLYGTAVAGGAFDAGVVFEVGPTGQETVLYNFTGFGDGYQPYGGVIRDSAGNLYGTAGGSGGIDAPQGVVYKLDPSGTQTVLYGFMGGTDGGGPKSGLFRDSAGNLYGTTYYGGIVPDPNCSLGGCGVVYKVDPTGKETVLYAFHGTSDGGVPVTGVVVDAAGNVYGTTSYYGANNGGVVYKIDSAGHETVLYNFTGGADGGSPNCVPYRNSAGVLFGTTEAGGTSNGGVVFKLTP